MCNRPKIFKNGRYIRIYNGIIQGGSAYENEYYTVYLNAHKSFQQRIAGRQIVVWRLRLQVSCHCETSAHTGCGNPSVRGGLYRKVHERVGVTAIFGGNRYLVPFNRGIATPVCALARNDSFISVHTRKHQATSKNYFLCFWARDFVPTKVLESPEYFVYCGLFKTHCWGKRSVQKPKG